MYYKKNSYSIHGIPVLKDNIIWVWVRGSQAIAIDPSIAGPVEAWLKRRNLKLIGILQTHHHDDHIGGTKSLLNEWPNSVVVASKADLNRIPFQTISVTSEDELSLMGCQIKVLDVAGHTKCHLAYYIPSKNESSCKPTLFCGDTLFGAGCGRIFEGTPEEMYRALQRINKLPEDTQIYCAHEYTEDNLRWANSIFPKDLSIKERLEKVKKIRRNGHLTLPTNIAEERKSNLFIRAKTIEEFKRLRLNKDSWKG